MHQETMAEKYKSFWSLTVAPTYKPLIRLEIGQQGVKELSQGLQDRKTQSPQFICVQGKNLDHR